MSKVNKNALKGLIKECLVEILMEGISSEALTESVTKKKTQSRSRRIRQERANKNTQQELFTEENPRSSQIDALTGDNFKHMTSDNVMAAILADTAKTTLQEQARGEKSKLPTGRLDTAARKVSQSNIEDLFEGSDKWANLAFSSQVKK